MTDEKCFVFMIRQILSQGSLC